MRIISGKLKGFNLHFSKNKSTRPLKDSARENIFNLLSHSNKINFKIKKANILDLYSGTGSFGLECLSRESCKVFFIEHEKEALNILNKNIKKLNVNSNTEILNGDVLKLIDKKKFKIKFDLIFCDPPFKNNNIKQLIDIISKKSLLNKNGIIIIHRNKKCKDEFPYNFKTVEEKNYGLSKIIFGFLLS